MASKGVPCFKIIILGQFGVGKSSLFRNFIDGSFCPDADPKSSIGLDFFSRLFKVEDDVAVELTLWDTGGMERVSSLTASYYKGAHAGLLCFSLSDKGSLSVLSQFQNEIKMYSKTNTLFLCGTKCDEQVHGSSCVTDEDIEMFVQNFGDEALSGQYKTSNKTGQGVKEMFEDMARVLYLKSKGQQFEKQNTIRVSSAPPGGTRRTRCCMSRQSELDL
ncbi:ras-related protein RABD2c [Lingula anatina]|uniref:Ras-related protein RABD2c n=1 Tax=Lingula anatina TaxID=7574 RepID=A0A1S3J762_LINAN|nr:ras-related protein RABD2c [Lingula anatina]XP_013405679.1 ras-related protein RABD2c [Lingula anatina]|eukprot:XP_013405678.1 ras-related protein RABD2c [Lingula anatina]